MKQKFSIIVPVYNNRTHLPVFLDEILASSYKNIEVVAVDNNSVDGSLKYLEERAKLDERLKVFTEKKQGPSAARKKGFNKSTGDYVTFVDADDLLSREAIYSFVRMFKEKGSDVIIADYIEHYSGSKRVRHGLIKGLETEKNLRTDDRIFLVKPTLCNKAFKRHLITEDLFLDTWFGEDMFVSLNAIKRAEKVNYLAALVYTYNLSDNGLSQNVDPDRLLSIITTVKALEKAFAKDKDEVGKFLAYSHLLYRIFRTVLIKDKSKRLLIYEEMLNHIKTIDIKNNKYYQRNWPFRIASFVLLKKNVYNNAIIRSLLVFMQTNKVLFKIIKKLDV